MATHLKSLLNGLLRKGGIQYFDFKKSSLCRTYSPPPRLKTEGWMYSGCFVVSLCNERFLQLLFMVAVTVIAFLSSYHDHYHHSSVSHTSYEYILDWSTLWAIHVARTEETKETEGEWAESEVWFCCGSLFQFSVYYFSRNTEMQANFGSAIKAN